MKTGKRISMLVIIVCLFFSANAQTTRLISEKTLAEVQEFLIRKHGESERERIIKGTGQLARNWRESDGPEKNFILFCEQNFLSGRELSDNFARIDKRLTLSEGYQQKMDYYFREAGTYTDTPVLVSDAFLCGIIPSADHYRAGFAQFAQLNYPYYTPAEKEKYAGVWSREQWAMAILGGYYERREGGPDSPYRREAGSFKNYMDHYFLRMDHISTADGRYLFPEGQLLHSHRGLRDDIKEGYSRKDGFERQSLENKVIEHVLCGNVPLMFLQDTNTRWNPFRGKLYVVENGKQKEIKEYETEDVKRYAGFRAAVKDRMADDAVYGTGSTVISRTFEDGSVKLEEMEALIREFLSDPVLAEVGNLVQKRLGRRLQPFDIWYSGFQEQTVYPSSYLDSLTRSRYTSPMALQKDMPGILVRMGFPQEEADFVGSRITVRPVVSGGYSNQPPMPGDTTLMTTMFDQKGLDYKSYRVAMHELGHCVCGVYCTNGMDYFRLAGVPNNGITEGYAEMFAYKNLEGLGLYPFTAEEKQHLLSLAAVWYLFEMGGQALTEIEVWKWMYAHPEATPAEVKEAVLSVSGNVWNTYFSKLFGGVRDSHILSIYNHFITGDLYLHNYFLSNVVMYQLHDAYHGPGLAKGLRKISREGRTDTERWMKNAVGSELSLKPLFRDVKSATAYFSGKK